MQTAAGSHLSDSDHVMCAGAGVGVGVGAALIQILTTKVQLTVGGSFYN